MPRIPGCDASPRKRKGGAPIISAKCFTIGSRRKGTDNGTDNETYYKVIPAGKSQRWVIDTDTTTKGQRRGSPTSAAKVRRRRGSPTSPAKVRE